MFSDASYLTRDQFVREVRRLLTEAGIESSLYSGHSFPIGAATTAAQVGMEAALIQTFGRWKSSAYQLYIKIPQEYLASISLALVNQSQRPLPT